MVSAGSCELGEFEQMKGSLCTRRRLVMTPTCRLPRAKESVVRKVDRWARPNLSR